MRRSRRLPRQNKELYQEAKGNGLDVKIIPEMIRLRKQNPKERRAGELLKVYWQAIKQTVPTGQKVA
jgi:uncharacterized protein (UPF0335 family)